MKLLLDTHAFIWLADNDTRLPRLVRERIESGRGQAGLSVVSVWEMAIKMQIGRLDIGLSIPEVFNILGDYDLYLLGITESHLIEYARLPLHHKDPFDRMLIAQAAGENATLLSCDARFDKRMW